MSNPLLANHILPPFSAIAAAQVTPAISELIAQGRAQLAQLLADLPHPSWDALVAPLEAQGDKLDQAWAPVSHLNSVANSEELRIAYTESVALLTDYSTEFSQNDDSGTRCLPAVALSQTLSADMLVLRQLLRR